MKARLSCVVALATGLVSASFAVAVANAAEADDLCGKAAWFDGEGLTASGETSDAGALTAAHANLPFGTRVEVDNLDNGRSVVVRINDRGSFARGRVILVSRAAAEDLGMIHDGTADVRLTVLDDDGSQVGTCGDAGSIAHAPRARPRPVLDEDAASEPRARPRPALHEEAASTPRGDEFGGYNPTEQGSAPSDPGPILEDAPAGEILADRFDVAFQAESWQEAELGKVLAAVAPRIAVTRRQVPVRTATTQRVKRKPGRVGLSPAVMAYLWSTELSMPHLARFERFWTAPNRLSQLTR